MSRTTVCALTVLVLTSATARAQGDDYLIADVLSAPFPSSLVAAPQGERLAWVFRREGAHSIWVAEGPAYQARELTSFEGDDGRPLSLTGFSADGELLLYRRGAPYNPDQNPAGPTPPGLFAISCAGGDARPIKASPSAVLSPCEPRIAWSDGGEVWTLDLADAASEPVRLCVDRGAVQDLVWSPDGRQLAFSSRRESHDESYSFIATVGLKRPRVRYHDASIYLDGEPRWSPSGRRLAFRRRLTQGGAFVLTSREFPQPAPWQLRVVDIGGGPAHDALPRPDRQAAWTSYDWFDDETLVFSSERDGWRRLYSVPAAGGSPQAITAPCALVEEFHVRQDLGRVLYVSNTGDVDRRHLFSTAPGDAPTALTSGPSIEWSPVATASGSALAYLRSDARYPGHPYVQSSPGDHSSATRLAAATLPDGFPAGRLVTPEQIIVHAADGTPVHCQLFRPTDADDGERRPAVLYFHGGPIRQMLLGWHYSVVLPSLLRVQPVPRVARLLGPVGQLPPRYRLRRGVP